MFDLYLSNLFLNIVNISMLQIKINKLYITKILGTQGSLAAVIVFVFVFVLSMPFRLIPMKVQPSTWFSKSLSVSAL